MMKRFFVIALFLFLSQGVNAQRFTSAFADQTTIGLRGGINLAGMHYTDKHLSVLPQETIFRPVGCVFCDIPLTRHLSIAPEFAYVERGMETNYTHSSGYQVSYNIHSRYVDFRLPLHIKYQLTSQIQPYLTIGLDAGYLLGGTIRIQQEGLPCPDTTIMIGKANMSSFYLGCFGGFGMCYQFNVNDQKMKLSIEATYNFDFIDSFTEMEHNDEAVPINVNAYNTTGKRLPKGFEITVGLAIPLVNNMHDACYGFSKNKWRY